MTKRISEEHQKIMIDAYLDGASAAQAADRIINYSPTDTPYRPALKQKRR